MVDDYRKRFWLSLALTIPVLVLSPMVREFLGQGMAPLFAGEEWVALALSSGIYFWGGWPFLTGALPEIRSGRPGMMTLVALAISTAYFYSAAVTLGPPGGEPFYWELATLVTIMLLGQWLEMRSVLGASRALEELVRLLPDTALRVRPDGGTEEVPVAALVAGDRVVIRPGAKVPVDGTITEGTSSLNEAMLTGESKPVTGLIRGGCQALRRPLPSRLGPLLRIRLTRSGSMRLSRSPQALKSLARISGRMPSVSVVQVLAEMPSH